MLNPSPARIDGHSPEWPMEMLNKVPAVTLVFWIIRIMTTTVGETGADFLVVRVGLGTAITGAIMASILIGMLVVQLSARRYVPWVYWQTVVLGSIVGTQITDAMTDQLGISLYASTAAFTVTLIAIFAVWYAVEWTLADVLRIIAAPAG
jgi:uncharacterized membrane-anchored protein